MTALRDRQRSTPEEKRKIFYFLFSIFYFSFFIFHFSERDAADDNDKLQLVGMTSRK